MVISETRLIFIENVIIYIFSLFVNNFFNDLQLGERLITVRRKVDNSKEIGR